MIRATVLLCAIIVLSGCNYNPRLGGWKIMLQKQPPEQPPKYYIPRLDPAASPSGIREEDKGRRIMNDSSQGQVPAPGQAH